MRSTLLAERLERYKIVEPRTGCWLWSGALHYSGYAHIKFKGKTYRAHRVSAHVFLGFQLDSDLLICHRCDVKHCFNPEHLFVGTPKMNIQDAHSKGRAVWGKRSHHAKLTEQQVLQIRSAYKNGASNKSLAEIYGVDRHTVARITSRKGWKHL